MDRPLDVESATSWGWARNVLAKPTLLSTVDLNHHPIVNDQPHFAVTNTSHRTPDVLEIELGPGS
jgi:hypothetical protein